MRPYETIWAHAVPCGTMQEHVDEMQNKAEAQPAWVQLAAGAAAGA